MHGGTCPLYCSGFIQFAVPLFVGEVIHHILFDNLKEDFPCIAACFRMDILDQCSLKFGTRNQAGSRKTRRAVEIKLHAITA
jgi:hypothetical protein